MKKTTYHISVIGLVIVMLLGIAGTFPTFAQASEGTTTNILSDTFTGTAGTNLIGYNSWSTNTGSSNNQYYYELAADPSNASNMAAKFTRAAGGGTLYYASYSLQDTAITEGVISIKFSLMRGDTNANSFRLTLVGGNWSTNAQVIFDMNRGAYHLNWSVNNDNSDHLFNNGQPTTVNQWYPFEVVYDMYSSTFTVKELSSSGQTVSSCSLSWSNTSGAITAWFGPSGDAAAVNASQAASFYVDDVNITKTTYSDEELVQIAASNVKIPTTPTANVTLPTTYTGGVSISWSSSNASVITNGGVVTKPAAGALPGKAVLTATFTKGSESTTKTYPITVPPVNYLLYENFEDSTVGDTWGGSNGSVGWETAGASEYYTLKTATDSGDENNKVGRGSISDSVGTAWSSKVARKYLSPQITGGITSVSFRVKAENSQIAKPIVTTRSGAPNYQSHQYDIAMAAEKSPGYVYTSYANAHRYYYPKPGAHSWADKWYQFELIYDFTTANDTKYGDIYLYCDGYLVKKLDNATTGGFNALNSVEFGATSLSGAGGEFSYDDIVVQTLTEKQLQLKQAISNELGAPLFNRGNETDKTENLSLCVKENVTLPTSLLDGDATVTWESSDASVMTNAGVITRHPSEVKHVTMTAVVTMDGVQYTEKFSAAVMPLLYTSVLGLTEESGDITKVEIVNQDKLNEEDKLLIAAYSEDGKTLQAVKIYSLKDFENALYAGTRTVDFGDLSFDIPSESSQIRAYIWNCSNLKPVSLAYMHE